MKIELNMFLFDEDIGFVKFKFSGSRKEKYLNETSIEFRDFFNNSNLFLKYCKNFNVEQLKFIDTKPIIPKIEETDYIIIGIISFIVSMGFISFIAFLFEKGLFKSCIKKRVELSKYLWPIHFGLQISDFFTDILFVYEIFLLNSNEIIINIVLYGSLTFLIIPYILNIIIA